MDILDQILAADMAKQYSDSKGGYTKPGKVLYSVSLDNLGMDYKGNVVVGHLLGLEVGKNYTIKTDSGTYSGVCSNYEGALYIGNLVLFGGEEDSGEPYLVVEGALDGEPMTVVIDKNNGTKATVSTPETIVPIDPKFLPGVCLPVVDLTGCAVGSEIMDEAINATLNKLAAGRMPIIGITKTVADGETSEVYACAGSGIAFIGSATQFQITSPTVTGKNGWVLVDAT